ncbi:hypothetical protein FQA39_LY02228 [Lamprigera yunnana]|nr:hypothetical protein FQA39_LY02228 [Lamprigera yunnana]
MLLYMSYWTKIAYSQGNYSFSTLKKKQNETTEQDSISECSRKYEISAGAVHCPKAKYKSKKNIFFIDRYKARKIEIIRKEYNGEEMLYATKIKLKTEGNFKTYRILNSLLQDSDKTQGVQDFINAGLNGSDISEHNRCTKGKHFTMSAVLWKILHIGYKIDLGRSSQLAKSSFYFNSEIGESIEISKYATNFNSDSGYELIPLWISAINCQLRKLDSVIHLIDTKQKIDPGYLTLLV